MFGIGEAIGGALGLVGTLATNASNEKQTGDTNRMNADSMKNQMDFQERMSNTAYVRAMEDMKNAGLNPMLGYKTGGASTPAGSSGGFQAAKMENALGNAVNSAIAVRQVRSDVAQKESQAELNAASAGAAKTQADANVASAQAARANAQKSTAEAISVARRNDIEGGAVDTMKKTFRNQAEADLAKARANKDFAGYDNLVPRINQGLGGLNSAKDLLNPFKGSLPKLDDFGRGWKPALPGKRLP